MRKRADSTVCSGYLSLDMAVILDWQLWCCRCHQRFVACKWYGVLSKAYITPF